MNCSSLKAGTNFVLSGKKGSLLRKLDDDIWQVEDFLTKRISQLSEEQLINSYLEGTFKIESTHSSRQENLERVKVQEKATEIEWEEALVRRKYVKAVLDVPSTHSRIGPIIEEVWDSIKKPKKPPNSATVIRWKNKFVSAEGDIASLIEKRGRKGNRESRFSDEERSFIEESINTKISRGEKRTVQWVIDDASALVIEENKLRLTNDQLKMPTRSIVQRMVNEIDARELYLAQKGYAATNNAFRSVLGHRVTSAPGERSEADHTQLDVYVIDDKTDFPLGRPWLTVCIDDYTRCVLGIFISFEEPSYYTVAECLKHALLPKKLPPQEHISTEHSWNSYGVMRELVVDNGLDFHSKSLEKLCYSMNIEIHYSARKTPWFKGKVERFLGTLNKDLIHPMPGTTFSNIVEKGDYDPVKHALIKYSVLKEIVNKWVVDVYHQKTHRSLGVSPSRMWETSIRKDEILVPDDPDLLNVVMGHSQKRVLSHKGIELFGLLYNSPELSKLRDREGLKLSVQVRVIFSNIGQIFVFSPDGSEVFKVPALRKEYASELTEYQHRICQNFAKEKLGDDSPDGWLLAKKAIADLIRHEILGGKKKRRRGLARYMEGGLEEKTKAAPEEMESLVHLDDEIHIDSEPDGSNEKGTLLNQVIEPTYRNRSNLNSDKEF